MNENNKLRTGGDMGSSGILDKGWSSLRNTFGVFWKRRFLVFVFFLIISLGLCGFQYYRSLHTASTILSLDYEEASKGLTPNRTRFNIFEIRSGEVMERLIEYAGLEGQITPDELSKCVSVRATHDKSINGNVNYISTSFVIRFTNNGEVAGRTAEGMLSLLCKAYREYFVEHYGFNHSILSFDISDLKFNDEYLMAVDLLELKCSQLENYVHLRSRESKNYQDPDTGITFSALEQQAKNYYAYDLARLRSYIIENGIASDRAELNSVLDYKIRMDRLMHNKLMAAYDEDNKGIQMYDAAMSAAVMIPSQDQTMNYYMARTKTGMDDMAIHADGQLAGAAEKMEQIEYNTYLAEKLEAGDSDPMKTEKANAMIQEMETSLKKLASDIQTVDSAYTNTKARNYIGFSEHDEGFADQIGLVYSLLCAVLILAAVFTCVFLRIFLSDKEKEV
ncbi:MAG: hypothetical protein IJ237_00140 [Oscillospiraceae bacterium]|nr:hypothetical protein [Oscillospiraceae bacterium]